MQTLEKTSQVGKMYVKSGDYAGECIFHLFGLVFLWPVAL